MNCNFNLFIMQLFYLNIKKSGDNLFSQQGNLQISSAHWSLTSVFGMGTGIASMLSSPEMFSVYMYTQKYIEKVFLSS